MLVDVHRLEHCYLALSANNNRFGCKKSKSLRTSNVCALGDNRIRVDDLFNRHEDHLPSHRGLHVY